ncbi:MAG: hypothetical protein OCC49_03580 [Fibrobacterales bacterium]
MQFILCLLALLSLLGCENPVEAKINNQPTKPVIIYPRDSVQSMPLSYTAGWSAADIDGDTLRYSVYIKAINSDTQFIPWGQTEEFTLEIESLAYDETYEMFVLVTDGIESVNSDTIQFSTLINSSPTRPVVSFPDNKQDYLATQIILPVHSEDIENDSIFFNWSLYTISDVDTLLVKEWVDSSNNGTLDSLTKGEEYQVTVYASDIYSTSDTSQYFFNTIDDIVGLWKFDYMVGDTFPIEGVSIVLQFNQDSTYIYHIEVEEYNIKDSSSGFWNLIDDWLITEQFVDPDDTKDSTSIDSTQFVRNDDSLMIWYIDKDSTRVEQYFNRILE